MGTLDKFYIDTNVIIGIIETPKPLARPQVEFIQAIDNEEICACTSELSLAECLVKPMVRKNSELISLYLGFITSRDFFPVYSIDTATLIAAAKIRAEYGCKLPDAIHVATALENECGVFVSNDLKLKLPPTLKLCVWDEVKF
jgi:predicted nucleic acid-binding protein